MITGYQGLFRPSQAAIIPAGQTESAAINCAGFLLTGLIIPSLFDGTALSFLVADSLAGFQADGSILFTGPLTEGDSITLNGVEITFTEGVPGANEVLIGADAEETMENLQAFLDATEDADLLELTYTSSGDLMIVKAVVAGTAGNAIEFDLNASDVTMFPADGSLGGGGYRPLYKMDNSALSMTVAAGRAYQVDPQYFQGVQFLKLKSGTAEDSARTIVCSLKGL